MKAFYTLIITAVLAIALGSCINDDFATGSSELPLFSTDTVKFDTVITLQGTATKQMVVYNRSSKQLNISSIRITNESQGARFYLNVDGVKGETFNDVEIRGEDSIYIFVEAYLDETQQDGPTELSGHIEFVTNGVTQHVVVTAWGQDVIRFNGDTIWSDTHLTAAKPYLIYDTLFVARGVTLTADAGATLLFHDKGAMRVGGCFKAMGTADAPVVLRGDRLDHVVGNISFDIMSGQWGGLIFTPYSYGNELQYVQMSGSSIGIHTSYADTTRRALHIFNSVLHNSSSSILTTGGAWVDAEGTEFSDAADGVVNFIGGRINLRNCTLANYYLFTSISEPIINLYIQDDGGYVAPLHACFDNCIIYGLCDELNIGDLTGTNVYLRNCLLKSAGEDDANFINCVWGGDPKFYTVREDYIFDYRVHNESDAIAKGDRSLCPTNARYDRYGVDRFSREGIDIGAYTWVPSSDEE